MADETTTTEATSPETTSPEAADTQTAEAPAKKPAAKKATSPAAKAGVKKATAEPAAQNKPLKVTLSRSVLGEPEKIRRTVKGLGLTRTHRSVQHADTPIIRGMLRKVHHLVTVENANQA